MKNQTAVEWLQEQLKKGVDFNPLDKNSYLDNVEKLFEQAKEMEREQIEDAYYDGQSLNTKSVTSQMIIDNSMSYYNEIYGGNK